jgi:hypothetical protein
MATDTAMVSKLMTKPISDISSKVPRRINPYRWLVIFLCGATAFFSAKFTFGMLATATASGGTYSQWVATPAALNAEGQLVFASDRSNAAKARTISALARESLRQQAINPVALRLLQMSKSLEVSGDSDDRFINLSEQLSRRDFGTQFWLIERSVARGDTGGALKAYDIAMRTNSESWAIFFPILTTALDDPEIRAAFAPYLKRKSPWISPFYAKFLMTSNNPSALADATIQAGGTDALDNPDDLKRLLFFALIAKGQFAELRRAFSVLEPDDAAALTSASLNAQTLSGRIGRVGWYFDNNPDVGGSATNSYTMSVFAGSQKRGIVASKLLFLPPGQYQLSTKVARADAPESAYLNWRRSCAENQQVPLWEGAQFGQSRKDGASHVDRFDVPRSCQVQKLELIADGGSGEQQGAEYEVGAITLRHLGIKSQPTS